MEDNNDLNMNDTNDTAAPDVAGEFARGLADINFPSGFDAGAIRDRFVHIMLKNGISLEQAQGVWMDYTDTVVEGYQNALEQEAQQQEQAEQGEETPEEDASQVADGYHLTREEAQAEADRIVSDKDSDYWNEKASPMKREKAIAYVNRLREIAAGLKASVEGYYADHIAEKRERMKDLSGNADPEGLNRSSAFTPPKPGGDERGDGISEDKHGVYYPGMGE